MNISLLFHTLIHLKARQIIGRIVHRLYRPSVKLTPLELRKPDKSIKFPALKNPVFKSPWTFTFLNKEMEFNETNFWNDPRCETLWLYNLHYFDWLNTPGALHQKTDGEMLIEKWINDNDIGKGVGWDPYPLSLRAVNWIKWHQNGNLLSTLARASLVVQARYLSRRIEYHLLANHLFTNAKALIFLGLFFSGREAKQWLGCGIRLLTKELDEQVLSDGGNFERSPMYHSIMLEDLFDLLMMFRCHCHPTITDELIMKITTKAGQMLFWLRAMCHPDGKIALFNDAAFGIAPDLSSLVKYAETIGIITPEVSLGVTDFPHSGYCSFRTPEYLLLIDAGNIGPDYQPGHAHADTFSFELSIKGERVIVDSGTSCYGTGRERLRQRSTAAHNTIMVDNTDSSQVWGGFRVAQRAKIVERIVSRSSPNLLTASHDGFRHIGGVGLHKRQWGINGNLISITDTLDGHGIHMVSASIHFSPGCTVEQVNGKINVSFRGDMHLQIITCEELESEVVQSTYHPEFGCTQPSVKLIMKSKVKLPFEFLTMIRVLT